MGREVNVISIQEFKDGIMVAASDEDFVFIPYKNGQKTIAMEEAIEQAWEWFYAGIESMVIE